MSTIRKLYGFIPMLLWLAVVFSFSFQTYQQQSIMPLLRENISRERAKQLVPDVSFHYGNRLIEAKRNPYGFMEFVFRKSAHLFVYAVLAASTALGLRGLGITGWRMALCALLLVFCAAAADEWNQLRHAGRTGAWVDVGIDFTGGCAGVLVYSGLNWLWRICRNRAW